VNDLNKVILIGRLGTDPELREYASGRKRASFPLATNRSYKDSEGNWVERTDWHQIVAWGDIAEKCEAKVKKGDPVLIEGRIQTTHWKDAQDMDRKSTQVITDKIRALISPAPRKNEGWEGIVESEAVLGV
jgi:single-strand DNA-binding protein